MSWNEFVVFWQEEQMNFFLAILFMGITAKVLNASATNKKMQYRSKEANKK